MCRVGSTPHRPSQLSFCAHLLSLIIIIMNMVTMMMIIMMMMIIIISTHPSIYPPTCYKTYHMYMCVSGRCGAGRGAHTSHDIGVEGDGGLLLKHVSLAHCFCLSCPPPKKWEIENQIIVIIVMTGEIKVMIQLLESMIMIF